MALNFINKVIRKITNLSGRKSSCTNLMQKPKVIPRSDHNISRSSLSSNVLKVLYRLKNNGYEAFLVGGCLRDILLGIEPKDFDVVTNARPEEVREIFHNCRLIGRRFPIAHVYFYHDIIEVATFRASIDKDTDKAKQSNSGMILRDNVYSNKISDDALRRDFTINALYYNIKSFSIIDYVGSLHDIRNKILRLIGDPLLRYREDPVRMLRVVRFAAKLGLTIHKGTSDPIFEQYKLLKNIAPARLFEEYKKLFLTGYGYSTYMLLKKYKLFNVLFPQVKFPNPNRQNIESQENRFVILIEEALKNTDFRISAGKTIAPGFLLAVFLWQELNISAQKLLTKNSNKFEVYMSVMDTILKKQSRTIAFPKIITTMVKDVWVLQLRLKKRAGKTASRVFASPKFRAGYDFLVFRANSGEPEAVELLDWWNKYIAADEKERWQMSLTVDMRKRKKRS